MLINHRCRLGIYILLEDHCYGVWDDKTGSVRREEYIECVCRLILFLQWYWYYTDMMLSSGWG